MGGENDRSASACGGSVRRAVVVNRNRARHLKYCLCSRPSPRKTREDRNEVMYLGARRCSGWGARARARDILTCKVCPGMAMAQ